MNSIVALFNNPYFNSILTAIVVFFTADVTNSGNPLLGVILSTFPVGIMSLLTIDNSKTRNDFLSHIVMGNVIISIMWMIISYFRHFDNDILAIIGFSSWLVMGVLYLIYLRFTN